VLFRSTSPWVFNVITKEKYQFANRTTDHWQPFDYYSGAIPSGQSSLQLSAPALAFAADSGGPNPTSQTLTALVSSGTITGLAVSGAPSWLTVTPAATSGASIVLTNSVNVSGRAPGVYPATVTVASGNAGQKTYSVSLTVRSVQIPQVLTSVSLTPPAVTVAKGTSLQFLADPLDQFGKHINGATIIWAVSGGGRIANGLFTADTICGGAYRVIATAQKGSAVVGDTSYLVVSRTGSLYRKINSGSNTYDVAGWERDDAYVSGGTDTVLTASDVTGGIIGAAPANVYKSVRHLSPHSYTIQPLPVGPYTVRMHFVETSSTLRKMSYTIGGVNVLQDFDVAGRAGGLNKALPIDLMATVQNDGKLLMSCTAAGGDVFEAGFEIIANDRRAITLLSPIGTEKYAVGQTITIQWSTDTLQVNEVLVYFSADDGMTFAPLTVDYGIHTYDTASWGKFKWTIPDTLKTPNSSVPTVSTQCLVSVTSYTNSGIKSVSDTVFTIAKKLGVLDNGRSMIGGGCRLRPSVSAQGLRLEVKDAVVRHSVDIIKPDGTIVVSCTGFGAQTYVVPRSQVRSGYYLVRISAGGQTTVHPMIVEY
jgi:hypothetical protein